MTREETLRGNGSGSGSQDPAYYAALGRAIKVARTQLGMARKQLAEAANVSYAYLSDIETGRGRPSTRSLFMVAQALGRSPSELLQEAEGYREAVTRPAGPSGVGATPPVEPDGVYQPREADPREVVALLMSTLSFDDQRMVADIVRRLSARAR